MRVAVVGGKLQGVEALYLAHKAGWQTVLVDRQPHVPGTGLCDDLVVCDVTTVDAKSDPWRQVDFIVPALEDDAALAALKKIANTVDVPLAYDPAAYAISSSKARSNHLFEQLALPTPNTWPEAEFPLIVKPDSQSGSQGVRILQDLEDLTRFQRAAGGRSGWIAQEFIDGPTFSLEVLGRPGDYLLPQVTDLYMDGDFDCKGVSAPTRLAAADIAVLERSTLALAEALQLRGMMDLEVVLGRQGIRLLEIDARLPSQTPTAVLVSTGLNMLTVLHAVFSDRSLPSPLPAADARAVHYEHIRVAPGQLCVCGEHIMGGAAKLQLQRDFFGADEALSDYLPGCDAWVATMIYHGADHGAVRRKRQAAVEIIRNRFGCETFVDPEPSFNDGESS